MEYSRRGHGRHGEGLIVGRPVTDWSPQADCSWRSLLKQENRHASHPSPVTQVVNGTAVSNRGRGQNDSPEGETGQKRQRLKGKGRRRRPAGCG